MRLQLNNESCSESEVKEDDDLGTESSRSHGFPGTKTGDVKAIGGCRGMHSDFPYYFSS